jgi:hypothetical protein
MNINITSEQQLVQIIRQHFNIGYSFQDCLNILESLTLREERDILTADNKALIAKLENPPQRPVHQPTPPEAVPQKNLSYDNDGLDGFREVQRG